MDKLKPNHCRDYSEYKKKVKEKVYKILYGFNFANASNIKSFVLDDITDLIIEEINERDMGWDYEYEGLLEKIKELQNTRPTPELDEGKVKKVIIAHFHKNDNFLIKLEELAQALCKADVRKE